ncbi:phage tail protein [Flavobacterium humi]|uniref:Uncharacterized protein n=1 Tax=Flavobacterium humi TaxID=2562683 RepID=A0A4Z0L5I5_9FLAO|nr:hypothetical protein [Flavobacterium humi]TGD57506.1 hypothetical protein E4635_09945 [Flavobacterium humi]
MKAEPISKKPSLTSKKPFFGAKKKLDVKLNKAQKRATTPLVLNKKPKKGAKEKKESDKKAAQSLKKPVAEIKTTAVKYQKHKESDTVLKEAQGAAILPSEKTNKVVANRSQVDVMDSQTKDSKKFDKKNFKKKLQEQINDTIKSKEDAKKIKNNGVDDTVTEDIGKSLEEEKSTAGGKVENSTLKPPAVPETPEDEVTANEPKGLIKEAPEAKTLTTQKGTLAPTKKPAEETDFTTETKVLDDQYGQNNLSQNKLQNSNEPSFIQADQQKQDSQAKAQELTDQNRKNEAKTIANTRASNTNAINGSYNGMLQTNTTINGGRFDNQKTKSAEENKIRNDVSRELDAIYNETNSNVLSYFGAIDFYIEQIFGLSLTMNLDTFSRRVAKLLDENTGFLNNVGAALTGDDLLSEVQIFDIAKKEFIEHMQKPIDDLVNTVDLYLNAANNAIKLGKGKVDKFWKSQSDETKKIAGDIYDESNTKFEELENSVESKEGAVIDKVTEKFSAALDELDARFEKAKEENKSWLDRAIDAVKAVINTIIELKNAIQSIARKAAKYAEQIIDDPITFFGNLSDGVGMGFTNFKNNIDKHLVKGVLEWLTGSMAGSEIELPKELNLEGITSLVLQILGISIKKIKNLVIDIIGKERFEFIEKGVDAGLAAGNNILNMFKILNEKGLAGLWEFIKEEFSDLKEMLIENVKTFVVETITMKAIEFLLSLLIPGAGFIRAAQLLIKFVVTLFQKAAQILKIIDGIIESFGNIIRKDLAGAAEKVENVFSGFLSLAISFLAAVLGLNGIVGKVQKFIQQKIRPKIDQILNKIAKKIKEVITKIGLTKLIDKSMKAVEKGKAWVDEKKKKAKDTAKKYGDKLLIFLGFKKRFTMGTETHTLLFEDKGGVPEFYVQSTPQKYTDFIKDVTFEDKYARGRGVSDKYGESTPQATAKKAGKVVDGELGKYEKTDEKDRKKWGDNLIVHMNNIADVISKYGETGTSEKDVPSIVEWEPTNPKGLGKKVNAKQLSANYVEGQEVGEQHDGGGLTTEWDIVSQNKGNNSVYYYVRGHLLNAKVGGVVNNTNLTPLSKDSNKEHLKNVERDAKKIVTGKKSESDTKTKSSIISYSVEALYGDHPKRNLPNLKAREKQVKEIEETRGVVPTTLKFTLKKLMIKNGKVVVDDSFTEISDSIKNELPPVVKLKS